MAVITREIEINAPKAKVWDVLADFGNISRFNPSVPKSYLTSGQTSGVGMTRHCDLSMMSGASVEERVLEWVDGERMAIEIYDGEKMPPMRKAIAYLSVSERNGKTFVTGTMDYTLKMGPLGRVMDAMMVKPQLGKTWEKLFAGLKHHLETGETVDHRTSLNLGAVVPVPA
ncbi:MAG: SRPBCC family protein [Chloroflexota bacterium]